MKIAIVGGGAMGSVWAVSLTHTGNTVTVVDVAQPLVDAINEHGLTVQGKQDTQEARLHATSNPAEVGEVDLVFFFVKAQHTASAAKLAQPLVSSSTTVVSLQNGWGNADVLAETFASEQIVVGVTYHSATIVSPALVAHTGIGPTYIGPYDGSAGLERSQVVSTQLHDAGIENTVTPNVKTEIWKKLILNAATLPTSSLTGLRVGELGQAGPMLALVDALAAEAVNVARTLGYEIELTERIERIHTVLNGGGAGKSSMLQDVEARRKTEIEVINGAVLRAAEQNSVDVPLNRAMVALIGGLERSWQR
jgi:2-dehydropantoate 2-reductase